VQALAGDAAGASGPGNAPIATRGPREESVFGEREKREDKGNSGAAEAPGQQTPSLQTSSSTLLVHFYRQKTLYSILYLAH
jgi:hypothetical protein